jgi:hypothetical protein
MKGHAILEAAHQVGRDGKGVVEEVGLHTETYFAIRPCYDPNVKAQRSRAM